MNYSMLAADIGALQTSDFSFGEALKKKQKTKHTHVHMWPLYHMYL